MFSGLLSKRKKPKPLVVIARPAFTFGAIVNDGKTTGEVVHVLPGHSGGGTSVPTMYEVRQLVETSVHGGGRKQVSYTVLRAECALRAVGVQQEV